MKMIRAGTFTIKPDGTAEANRFEWDGDSNIADGRSASFLACLWAKEQIDRLLAELKEATP